MKPYFGRARLVPENEKFPLFEKFEMFINVLKFAEFPIQVGNFSEFSDLNLAREEQQISESGRRFGFKIFPCEKEISDLLLG